jgi:hypothetical protein
MLLRERLHKKLYDAMEASESPNGRDAIIALALAREYKTLIRIFEPPQGKE